MAEPPFRAEHVMESMIPRLAVSAVAMPVAQVEIPTAIIMSDKNPKAKRKQQAQQQMHKQHKAEENQRHQQQLLVTHLIKHPHEMKG